jgi:hypothetical protein
MVTVNPFEMLVDQLERLLQLSHQTRRNNVQGEMATETLAQIKSLLSELARSPEVGLALGAITQIGKNALQEQLEVAQLNPCETVEPVRHIREAYNAIDQAVAELYDFARDGRFWWSPNSLFFPLEVRVPLSEIIGRIVALRGYLFGASQHANRATSKALRLRDPRTALGAQTTQLPAALQDTNAYLIRIPDAPYHSEHEAVKRIRALLVLIAIRLHETVTHGRKRLKRESVDKDGEMVRPSTISAALAELNYVLWCSLLTCMALSRLATESQRK